MFWRNLIRRILGIVLCVPIAACSSVSFTKFNSDFSYVPREQLDYDPLYLTERSDNSVKNYGAIKYKTDEMNENEAQLFILNKNKGIWQAETMIKQTKDKKFFFSLGIDRKS